ncbi:MAG TPA: autotransporter-associated beta strand repeat-containing protein, partial [Chthoniobacterales bacterium]|nr:autotransporter-associated beta strand repeat-containing protein [Chthoniobacterales bacterium]
MAVLTAIGSTALAGSATWAANPSTTDWNTAINWEPQTVPNGPLDVATFATSSETAVSLSAQTEVSGITFNSGASAFTITVSANDNNFGLNLSGVGITNNSGTTQKIATAYPGYIQFFNSATAGTSTSYVLNGGSMWFWNTSAAGSGTFTGYPWFHIYFQDSATAQNGNFILNGPASIYFDNTSNAGSAAFTLNIDPITGEPSFMHFRDSATAQNGNFTLYSQAQIYFFDTSSAGSGVFTLNGDPATGRNSVIYFQDSATAQNGNFTLNASAEIYFYSHSSAGNGTFVVKGPGAGLYFTRYSKGGTSRVELFGTGTGDSADVFLDISGRNAPGLSIGSLEGAGNVFLGSNRLTVGSNNLSTTFSGVIADYPGDPIGYSGSLSKTGKGKLTLSNTNLYDGGTTIDNGTLVVKNGSGSATGSGPVQVNSGTLSGKGSISGAVTVGNGTTAGAILHPGIGAKPSRLLINNTVSFNATSAFKCYVKRSTTPVAGKLSALGVTIGTNVSFTLLETGTGTLTAGTVFTVIKNTSANPIFGRFSNLPDGGTITTVNGTVYKANYSGGTG